MPGLINTSKPFVVSGWVASSLSHPPPRCPPLPPPRGAQLMNPQSHPRADTGAAPPMGAGRETPIKKKEKMNSSWGLRRSTGMEPTSIPRDAKNHTSPQQRPGQDSERGPRGHPELLEKLQKNGMRAGIGSLGRTQTARSC